MAKDDMLYDIVNIIEQDSRVDDARKADCLIWIMENIHNEPVKRRIIRWLRVHNRCENCGARLQKVKTQEWNKDIQEYEIVDKIGCPVCYYV